ncbi:hypothetical protein VOLCADRAFT_99064 [Volvox carteri f. nagariensis]|uniref:Btz domain-containing protein n=1 Tax=Volvox carteri f. nagariensis TaxID=3068 RepID=D8UGY6_VOLCA|nr:uncharacterized protein VOLCADRAFT_99064 [Volvox carteri f. nagariensis]EFJ41033.1 hypothetical protein VOLCADRAFT_99064 [Volvox carteri f. nagariensis]|eukprot:XP_002957897.1 hypothetical protein VOLCADRAFT_99064 [Volvox carteri f. nagariensis]
MSSRYFEHDDREEPEERPKRSSHAGGTRFDRKEDRLQGRPKIDRDPDTSARGNRSLRDAPPTEPPRFNKYSGHDDRVERDDPDGNGPTGRKKYNGDHADNRGWERTALGRGEQKERWERHDSSAGAGGFRGGRGGYRGGSGTDDSRVRRDGHDDRDEHDYSGGRDAHRRRGGGAGGGGWDERPGNPGGGAGGGGGGRLSRTLEARLGEPRNNTAAGAAAFTADRGEGGDGGYGGGGGYGSGRGGYRNEHDDRDNDGGWYAYGGGGGGGGRGRYRGEHDDRVADGGGGGIGRYGGGGRGGGARHRDEHDHRDAVGDDDDDDDGYGAPGGGKGRGGGRGRGRGWGSSRLQDDAGGSTATSGGTPHFHLRSSRKHIFTGYSRRDRERSRSPMGRWGHDKFQELVEEEEKAAEGQEGGEGKDDVVQQDGAAGWGAGAQRGLGPRRRWGAGPEAGLDRNGSGGGAGGEGDEAHGDKLDDELMAEAAEAAAYDDLGD